MGAQLDRVPVEGTWVRHVPAGVDGLAPSRGGNGGRFNPPDLPAVYVADSEPTTWAEWYRYLAERGKSPADDLPREICRLTLRITLTRCLALTPGARHVRTTLGAGSNQPRQQCA